MLCLKYCGSLCTLYQKSNSPPIVLDVPHPSRDVLQDNGKYSDNLSSQYDIHDITEHTTAVPVPHSHSITNKGGNPDTNHTSEIYKTSSIPHKMERPIEPEKIQRCSGQPSTRVCIEETKTSICTNLEPGQIPPHRDTEFQDQGVTVSKPTEKRDIPAGVPCNHTIRNLPHRSTSPVVNNGNITSPDSDVVTTSSEWEIIDDLYTGRDWY